MSKITKQTSAHNIKMRRTRHVLSYRYADFLAQSSGDLLINGGLKEKRRECLIDFITATRQKETKTIFVFSEDTELEKQLINLAQNGSIGQLYVCNQTYPIYNFFCGMRKNFITEFFNRIALERGVRDVAEINSYTQAFLSVLSDISPINLTSIQRFAQNDDTSIKNAATVASDGEIILASTRGGVTLRGLLRDSSEAFSSITTPDCETNFCLSNLTDKDCVVLINTPANNPEFYSIYFAMELKSIVDRSFVCIFDDSVMLNDDTMRSVVELMKQRPHIDVIVSHENIVSVSETDDVIKNFNRNLIFFKGNTSDVDLQKILSTFGQYTHIDPFANSSKQVITDILPGSGKNPLQYQRDRVMIQEEYKNEALLKGGSGSEIIITRRLLNQRR